MKKRAAKTDKSDGKDRLLPRLSLFIFNRSKTAAILWLLVTVFGIASYTTLMKREGFPSVNIPFTVINGTYFVNDAAKVDQEIAKPVSELLLKDSRIKTIQSQSQPMGYNIIIQYEDEKTNAGTVGPELQSKIQEAKIIPKEATIRSESPKFGFTERGDDGVISVYSRDKNVTTEQLASEVDKLAAFIRDKKFADLESITSINPFVTGIDPTTGQTSNSLAKFDRLGIREDNKNNFYNALSVGYMQKDGTDVIKLHHKLEQAVAEYNNRNNKDQFGAQISATYAHDIKDQVAELQHSLLIGLLAVLVVGSIVIAIRASLITVLSMLTVLAIAVSILFLIGYTLNTITLFALILGLGLIVDDTIIMVEAIDAQRRKQKDARKIVHTATRKVSRAMVAATSTAALSFAPLLFVGGILGSFIRAIPVTVIISLVTSLVVALVFIPLFARYILLGKKQLGEKNVKEPAARIEAKIANFIGKPMIWARNSRKKLMAVGLTAVLIGFGFIAAGGYLFQKVTFNIFPSSKDSNALMVTVSFNPDTDLAQAGAIADQVDTIVGRELGSNFEQAAYYSSGSARNATLNINLTPYGEREVTAPRLIEQLETELKKLPVAQVKVAQVDAGPPATPFVVKLETTDREKAFMLAKDLKDFLLETELKRLDGTTARVETAVISNSNLFTRSDGKLYVDVTANFDGTDTSTLVTLAQSAVTKEFTTERLNSYGLSKDVIKFDLGQEQENQDSFKTLAIAFPVLLFVIYLLLAAQFRSLLQPLLIFLAIPFSLFGITLGLYLTDNAFSFFAMLGFFALIGLSLKNTILLTDYANQERARGRSAIDAAVEALHERFRPLIATSLTAVVSLIPLALTSPFWQGLATVLIGGLLSSTFLVIVVFPYYYLGAEFLRMHISRKAFFTWLVITVALTVALIQLGLSPAIAPVIGLAVIIALLTYKRTKEA